MNRKEKKFSTKKNRWHKKTFWFKISKQENVFEENKNYTKFVQHKKNLGARKFKRKKNSDQKLFKLKKK